MRYGIINVFSRYYNSSYYRVMDSEAPCGRPRWSASFTALSEAVEYASTRNRIDAEQKAQIALSAKRIAEAQTEQDRRAEWAAKLHFRLAAFGETVCREMVAGDIYPNPAPVDLAHAFYMRARLPRDWWK